MVPGDRRKCQIKVTYSQSQRGQQGRRSHKGPIRTLEMGSCSKCAEGNRSRSIINSVGPGREMSGWYLGTQGSSSSAHQDDPEKETLPFVPNQSPTSPMLFSHPRPRPQLLNSYPQHPVTHPAVHLHPLNLCFLLRFHQGHLYFHMRQ